MNSSLLPPRNGHHPNGTGGRAAVADASASAWRLSPSSAAADLPPAHTGDLADSPITLNVADRAALDGPVDGTEALRTSDSAYGARLRGPSKAETPAPHDTLAESVLQHLRGAVVVLDADLRVRMANRAFCQTVQVAPSQIEGRWFPELGVGDQDVPQLHEFFDQILARGSQVGGVDIQHDDPTTRRKSLMIHGRRLIGPGPGDDLILLELEDVTDRVAEVRQRRELIVTAVHELRNPLTAIKGYAQLMQRRKGTGDRALSTILEQAQQVSRLVDDLLAHSSSGIAQPCLKPCLIDLISLARASVEQAQLHGPGHVIRLESREASIQGFWDGGRLAQVFANLLGNAVKYSPAGGEIVVRIRGLGPKVRISISDQGVGIAADALPRIFDPFYRVGAVVNDVPGLGLGLHVSKMLVEAHEGSIWVQSDPGAGSTFTFEIPCVAPAPAARAARPRETA
jgi:two-component system, OmpR family, sensor histidine kinase VicK